ncbi:MAG: electron transfer flavoprotein subunit alpha/FixB family protein [Nitrososphaerales archaeon]
MAALVYSESPEVALELVTLASSLDQNVIVACVGSNIAEEEKKFRVSKVSEIVLVSSPQKDWRVESIVDALEQVSKQTNPRVILIGATRKGREVAPRLASRLGVGCITDASEVKLNGEKLSAKRLVWGGNAIATVSSNSSVLTIPPRANERASGEAAPKVTKIDFTPKTRTSTLLEMKARPSGQGNIKEADAIVSAGRGFKKKEDLAILDELAFVLHATIGASRPLTSDLGWMSEERQVGLSGVTVKPKLYVAVGISGQIQHLTGMRDSKIIVAINADKNAPIFQECDYGIVGDLYQVVPLLVKALKSKTGR